MTGAKGAHLLDGDASCLRLQEDEEDAGNGLPEAEEDEGPVLKAEQHLEEDLRDHCSRDQLGEDGETLASCPGVDVMDLSGNQPGNGPQTKAE